MEAILQIDSSISMVTMSSVVQERLMNTSTNIQYGPIFFNQGSRISDKDNLLGINAHNILMVAGRYRPVLANQHACSMMFELA